MQDITTIMCVIDPESEQQHAMNRGAWLAKQLKANLELTVCYYNEYLTTGRLGDYPALENAQEDILEGLDKRLESLAEPLRKSGLTVNTTSTWDHPLYEGIIRQAIACDANIVFKDTHHHSALTRALLTNTDWNLMRACPVPLWLVKPRDFADKPVVIAAIDPLHEHDKPAALDDEILITSKSIAKAVNAEVRAFHAYDPRIAVATATANAYIPVSLPFDEIEKQMHEQHEKRFNEVVDFHGVDADKSHLVAGVTHEELPEFAASVNADVVVMGAVSRNRWKRLFIGSTAERTLEHLHCDLLIVKPDWFQTPAEICGDQAA
ncbi:MAG: universal stress protein [Woeseiaceae bacterium]|nr:universal stress protein [Woeseiaceae bacterium]